MNTRKSNEQNLISNSKHTTSQRRRPSNFRPSRNNISIQLDTSYPSGCRPLVLYSLPRHENTSLLSNTLQKDFNSSQSSNRDQSIGIQNIQGKSFNAIDQTLKTMEVNICQEQSAYFVNPGTQFKIWLRL